LTEARLVLLNDLGWALLMAQKFSDAAAPLQAAREGRERLRAGRARCDKDQRDDVEFATVNQNLADVSLALGRFDEALRYAHQARQCRTELGRARKALESMKTEGYALIYRGDESAGKEFLQTYSDSIRRDRDDVILPAGDPFISGAIVAGKFVPLEQFVRLPDKYAEPKPKPSSAPDDQEMEKK
jgi:tetratricopeptide (TPR) repeat protein